MGATLPSVFYSFGGSLFSASTPVAYQVIRANSAATAFELVTVYSRSETDGGFVALTGTQTVAGAKTFSGDCIFTNATNPVMIVRGTGGGPSRLVVDSSSSNSASLGFREANSAKWSFGSVSGTFYIYNEVGGAYALQITSSGSRWLVGGPSDDGVNRLQVNGGVSLAGTAPASAAATGVVGSIRWDSGFIYICTATNTWKRVAIATW